jgi:AcrR family transcriptional regulator
MCQPMPPHSTEKAKVDGYKHGRVPRAVREQQLLDHAEKLFIDNGYGGFSIEDLCRAAGVSRPVVYEHFGSKDGLFLATVSRIRDEFERDFLTAAADAGTLAEALERASDAFFAILERTPERWSLVYGGPTLLVGPNADALDDLRSHTVDRIAALITGFVPGADPERVTAYAHALSGSGEQLGRWWLRNLHVPRSRLAAHHYAFVRTAFESLTAAEPSA